MTELMKRKLKHGFTAARWGIDICIGCLIVAADYIAFGIAFGSGVEFSALITIGVFLMAGIVVFAAGRIIVGLQSRSLNFENSRPLTDEERWFVREMLKMEDDAAKANLAAAAARVTPGVADDYLFGIGSGGILGRFGRIGKRYMGKNVLFNRLPIFLAIAIAVISTVFKIV